MAFCCCIITIQSSHQTQQCLLDSLLSVLLVFCSLSEVLVLVLSVPGGHGEVGSCWGDGHVGVCVVVGGDVPVSVDVSSLLLV